jgi:hypothetical protein
MASRGRLLSAVWTIRNGKIPRHHRLPGQRSRQAEFSGENEMKKQTARQCKGRRPAFDNESAEAEWWYENRSKHGKQLLAAVKSGEAEVSTKEKLRERIAASKRRQLRWWPCESLPQTWLWRAGRPKRRDCRTRPISSRYCTKHSPSEKSETRVGRASIQRRCSVDPTSR